MTDIMYSPKVDLKNKLCELTQYDVMQSSNAEFTSFPLITFYVADNEINYTLDNEIASQRIEAIVDLWAEDSETLTQMLKDVESKLRTIFYKLTFSNDVPNIDNKVLHMTTRFEKII